MSSNALVRPPTKPPALASLAQRRIRTVQAKVPEGPLRLVWPDGSQERVGASGASPVTLSITNWNLLLRIALAGDVGFGEGYVAGEWESDDLPGLLRLLARAGEALAPISSGTLPWQLARRLLHAARQPNRRGSRAHVVAHYDLSNDFYGLWLDPTMTYSRALFAHPDEPLEQAQRRKLQRIAKLASLARGRRVLEIGCGWGSFLELASALGSEAVGITLSQVQANSARARLAKADAPARVEVRDWRDCAGSFDAVVAIEMLEAVGHARLGAFFATLDRLFALAGVAVLQTITIPDHRYERYRRNPDFIQKHIFPGGHLPSVAAMAAALARTRLVMQELHNIGPHYALTLRRWREGFLAQRARVRAMGFTHRFLRQWEYYLAYCEAGFAEGLLNDHMVVLRRAGEPHHPQGAPWVR